MEHTWDMVKRRHVVQGGQASGGVVRAAHKLWLVDSQRQMEHQRMS